MKLIDLIPYLRNPATLGKLYAREQIDPEAEDVDICMKNTVAMDSEVSIFEMEETNGLAEFERDGVHYVSLFSIDLAIEFMDMLGLNSSDNSDHDIAARLIEYWWNDA